MAKDYSGNITTAQTLITKFGRSVTFTEYDSTAADVAEPWNGPADPRASVDSTLVVDAVFVAPSGSLLGFTQEVTDLVKHSEQICIVSPGASDDLSAYQEITDGSTSWKITGVEVLQPGPDVVLAYVGVKR